MSEVTIGVFSTAVGILLGWFLNQLQCRLSRREQQHDAVAALRFELESNNKWARKCLETRIFLRDEACLNLRKSGYVSFLAPPIPSKVIDCYSAMYQLNEALSELRTVDAAPTIWKKEAEAAACRTEYVRQAEELQVLLDRRYPSVGRNYGAR